MIIREDSNMKRQYIQPALEMFMTDEQLLSTFTENQTDVPAKGDGESWGAREGFLDDEEEFWEEE